MYQVPQLEINLLPDAVLVTNEVRGALHTGQGAGQGSP